MTGVLVFGTTGQVATELGRADWPDGTELVRLSRDDADLTDPAAVGAAIEAHRPDVVVNAAAYTAVDRAETEPVLAYAVNAVAVEAMAAATRAIDAGLIHVSTDYVFDGTSADPYLPTDSPRPLGVYGRSKLAGEYAALSNSAAVVLRTSWVYSSVGNNFVKTMRRLAAERDDLGVVDDQHGCPTSAVDIARAIVAIVANGWSVPGVYHCAAPDAGTWADLAIATIDATGNTRTTVRRITTADYPTPAPRPANSRLDTTTLTDTYRITLRPWREALAEVSAQLDQLEGTA
ncbi:MAG: dTDP-4-dehydrorhamnose reductase [Acidimicrobiales bacterium]